MTLRDKFIQLYQTQVAGDGALDLFDPSVEVLAAPFYDTVKRHLTPVRQRDVFPEKFAEYFSRGTSVATARVASGAVVVAEDETNLPLGLPTDCGHALQTWSIPRPCLQVRGTRGNFGIELKQLFVGDLVWLFFHERMGIHRMVGALLDDFVTRGRFPIRPSGVEGLMLETMVREVKAGLSSTVRERSITYSRVLGWRNESGSRLDLADVPKNTSFNQLFHRLMLLVLGYFNEKRLAVAIQNTGSVGMPSRATLTSIRETIGQLRKSFDPFRYGRNHTHTLSGIVWTFAGLELVLRLRSQLGIPEPYDSADELIPAAYDLLLGPGEKIQGNRYTAHRDCAEAGRAILLDVQALDFEQGILDEQDLEEWLREPRVESTFELYRSAYRVLTGVDVGSANVAVEQAA